jgi:hypothetical protein
MRKLNPRNGILWRGQVEKESKTPPPPPPPPPSQMIES